VAWSGSHRAAVVHAVGEEHDEGALALAAGFAFGLFEAGEGDAETVADGGAVFQHADAEALELAGEPVVVEGERGHRVGASGEKHYADAVGGRVGR
jgi:hypothetical protein